MDSEKKESKALIVTILVTGFLLSANLTLSYGQTKVLSSAKSGLPRNLNKLTYSPKIEKVKEWLPKREVDYSRVSH